MAREERVDGGRGEIAGIKKNFENKIPNRSSLYGLCGLSVDLGFTVPGQLMVFHSFPTGHDASRLQSHDFPRTVNAKSNASFIYIGHRLTQ